MSKYSSTSYAYRKLRQQILADDPWCVYCNAPATTIDHVIPKSRGGTDDRSNLVSCCQRCNRAKSDGPKPQRVSHYNAKYEIIVQKTRLNAVKQAG